MPSTKRNKLFGRPGHLPLLGYSKHPLLWTVFGVPVLEASVLSGLRLFAPIRSIDNVLPNAKTRTIHTDAGRVKVPADWTPMKG